MIKTKHLEFIDCEKLKQEIISFENRTSALGVQTNGWSSEKFYIKNREIAPIQSVIYELITYIQFEFLEPDLYFWFVCLEKGGEIKMHDHRPSKSAAVFYVDDCNESEGGELVFESGDAIKPEKGLLVMFNGNDRHKVNKYLGENPRYSVAVNRV